jgi:hypothetical protein
MNRTLNTIKKVVYIIGILILIVVIVNFQQRISEMNHLEGQLKLIQAQGTNVMQTQEDLMTQVAYANSDASVKAWAYSEGRWYLPNETPIMVLPLGNPTAIPETDLISPTSSVENWEVWWKLFFGKEN